MNEAKVKNLLGIIKVFSLLRSSFPRLNLYLNPVN